MIRYIILFEAVILSACSPEQKGETLTASTPVIELDGPLIHRQ